MRKNKHCTRVLYCSLFSVWRCLFFLALGVSEFDSKTSRDYSVPDKWGGWNFGLSQVFKPQSSAFPCRYEHNIPLNDAWNNKYIVSHSKWIGSVKPELLGVQDAATEGPLVRCKPFICLLQLQVKKQSCLFERWCWTIFSQWDLGTSLKVAQKAAEIPSRRHCPYMAHAESPLFSVVSFCPPLACLPLHTALTGSPPSTSASPSLLRPCPCDVLQRKPRGAPC